MGPWGEPELLVWRPEAVASAPPLPVGLEVKLGTLVLLLVLTLICSLVPICVLRRPGASPEASAFSQKVLSLLDHGAQPAAASGSALPSGPALPAPPRITLAGYCDCFASGDFCNNCSCDACCSHLRHGLERFKAIKAKIMCSSICKCVGCKHYEESPEQKPLMAMPNYAEAGSFEGSHYVSGLPKFRKERRSSCISWEVVEAACACLLAQGEEAEKGRCSEGLAQQMVLEEFGRCLSQILHMEFKSKGLKME